MSKRGKKKVEPLSPSIFLDEYETVKGIIADLQTVEERLREGIILVDDVHLTRRLGIRAGVLAAKMSMQVARRMLEGKK